MLGKDPIELYTYNLYSYSYIDHWIEIFLIFPRKKSIQPFPSSLYLLTGIKGTGKNASQHPQFIFARGNHSGLANSSQRHLTWNGRSVILSCIYMYTCFSFGRRESVHSLVKSSPVWFFRLQVVRSVDELLIRRRSPSFIHLCLSSFYKRTSAVRFFHVQIIVENHRINVNLLCSYWLHHVQKNNRSIYLK